MSNFVLFVGCWCCVKLIVARSCILLDPNLTSWRSTGLGNDAGYNWPRNSQVRLRGSMLLEITYFVLIVFFFS